MRTPEIEQSPEEVALMSRGAKVEESWSGFVGK